jgi:anti-sigma regulatory factor (Ser/Thr protein kinase)
VTTWHPAPAAPVLRTQLPASLTAPRQARAAIRQALHAWGLHALASDAELLGSELVANAAEHGAGPIGLTIRQHVTPGGRGIACEITDTSPNLPASRPCQAHAERGRGLAIVTALATTSGITTTPRGKTAWFTLTPAHPEHSTGADREAGA